MPSPSTEVAPIPLVPELPPPLPRVEVDVGAVSHPGKVRTNNEDHYLVTRYGRSLTTLKTNLPEGDVPRQLEETGYALSVADGMGGAAAGEVASRMALTVGLSIAVDSPKWPLMMTEERAREHMETWRERFRQIDAILAQRAWDDPKLTGMGTTLTLACSVGTNLLLYHVGDSPAYLFRGGRLHRLTRDHTVAQELADAGQIDPAEVVRHRQRHVLTRYLGGGRDVEAEIQHLQLADGDRLLLCSDGLNDMVPDDRIADALQATPGADAACRALVERALEAGGRDNVTVVVADYRIQAATGATEK